VHHGKQVDLPQSDSVTLETQEAISITIENAKNGLKISVDDGLPCNLAELEQVLREKKIQSKGKEPDLQIFADKTVPYQSLYNVLDCITKAGLSKISLQAKTE
jgi:biopolymer transport protein ExbD